MAKPKITVKEAKLVKAKAAGLKHDEAWDEAGYSQNSSKATKVANTHKILNKPHVNNALQVALEEAGITPETIMAPVADALNHEDLEMRLKGHDRAVKIMQPQKQEGSNTNFVQVTNNYGDRYAD